jgi:hypothetical protein
MITVTEDIMDYETRLEIKNSVAELRGGILHQLDLIDQRLTRLEQWVRTLEDGCRQLREQMENG